MGAMHRWARSSVHRASPAARDHAVPFRHYLPTKRRFVPSDVAIFRLSKAGAVLSEQHRTLQKAGVGAAKEAGGLPFLPRLQRLRNTLGPLTTAVTAPAANGD